MSAWISMRDSAASLQCSRQQLHRLRAKGKIEGRQIGNIFEYLLESFPADAQERYWTMHRRDQSRTADDAELYASAPEYARRKADRYLQIITAAGDLAGADLREWVAGWNQNNPDNRTSYCRLVTERNRFKSVGVSALLGKWGKRSSGSCVPDDLFVFFKSLYLCDGRPSVDSCWKITLGHAIKNGIPAGSVPSASAFYRRLKREVPEQAVYTAREGVMAANRHFGFYIKRNYNDLLSGECWISDHAQLDVACTYTDLNGKTKVCFPWITAWRDFKSGFWPGWNLHPDAPNSDHIFLSFYRSSVQHGIPAELYLDNGKDYRVRDFAGGRKHHRLDIDEARATSLTAALGIRTTYAWPYNAQAKAIERDFLRQKEWFSKHAPGYRGGNVVERPETLNSTISGGGILSLQELDSLLTVFINDVVMITPLSSGYRKGKCPAAIWQEEYPLAVERQLVRHVSKNALMLFCTRVSGVFTIGRRGISDTKFGVDYYAEWMEGQRGRKVYMRRDPKAMQEAWVFDAATDAYIDNAYLLPKVDALARTEVSKSELQRSIQIKRNSNKLMKMLSRPDFEVPFNEKIALLSTAARAISEMESGYTRVPDTTKRPLLLTDMDKVLSQQDRNRREGTADLSILMKQIDTHTKKRRKLAVFESDLGAAANQ